MKNHQTLTLSEFTEAMRNLANTLDGSFQPLADKLDANHKGLISAIEAITAHLQSRFDSLKARLTRASPTVSRQDFKNRSHLFQPILTSHDLFADKLWTLDRGLRTLRSPLDTTGHQKTPIRA